MLKKLQILSLLFLLSILSVSNLSAQSIGIISPTPNTTVAGCSPFTVTWTSTGITYSKFDYSIDGGQRWINSISFTSGNSTSPAQVPYFPSNPNIMIRVTDYYNSAIGSTVSGIYATGMGVNKIEVTSPAPNAAPTSYAFGNGFYVYWNQSFTSCTPMVNILLSTNGGINFPITLLSNVANTASYAYVTHNVVSGATNAIIKIEDAYYKNNFGLSGGLILLPQPQTNSSSISISSPSNNANVSNCSANVSISYTGNIASYFDFQISKDNGVNWSYLYSVYGNSTSSFNINTDGYVGNVKTRFRDQSSPYNTFAGPNLNYTASVPVLKFTNPTFANASEKVSDLYVVWNLGFNCVPQISLEISSDGGTNWTSLYNGTNTGSYILSKSFLSTLPSLNLLKISQVGNPSNSNTTQLVLQTPTLSVKTTVGISFSCPTAYATLNFSKLGMSGIYNFRIKYSTNSGTSWNTIVANTTNYNSPDFSYFWSNFPNSLLGLSNVMVKIIELGSGISVTGINTIDFAAQLPAQTILAYSPTTEQQVCNTQFQKDGTYCGNVDVYLTTNAGASLIPVTVNANFTSFAMEMPVAYDDGVNYRVIYRSVTDPTLSVMGSNFKFTRGFGTINYSNLVAGTGNTINIKFTNACVNPLINIEVSTDSGVNFYNLTTNSVNNTTYIPFNVPNIATTGFRARVSVVGNPSVSILGTNATITLPNQISKSITVTSITINTACGFNSTINWRRNYSDARNFQIDISRNGGIIWENVVSSTFSNLTTNSYNFLLSNFPSSTVMVRITDNSEKNIVGYSSEVGYSLSAPTISINSPSNLVANSASNYVYFSQTCVPLIDVFVSTNNGVDFNPLYSRMLGTSGYFVWQAYNTPASQSRYKIVSSTNPSISTISAPFSITGAPALSNITITGVPTGISACTPINLSVKNIDNSNTNGTGYMVDLTLDNGASWSRVLNIPYAYGYPTFTTGNISIGNLPVNTQFFIRIVRTDNNLIAATTTGITITSVGVSGLAFTAPVSNTLYLSNGANAIQLNTTGAGCVMQDIKLEYSLDNGANFSLINDKVAASTNYTWFVPAGTNTNTAVLRASNIEPSTVTVSSQAFRITDPGASISVPGLLLQNVGVYLPVQYVGISPGEYYYGYYSTNGGTSWNSTGYNIYMNGNGNSSIYFITPPVNSLTGFKFAIANNSSSFTTASKNFISNDFTVDRPLLSTTSPIAGQTIQTGSGATTPVSSTFAGWSGTYMYAFYSYDNGATAVYIGNNYYLSGAGSNNFTWTLPSVTSLTSAMITWGNSSTWASSTIKYYGDAFNLVPSTNNQITVTGLSDTAPCQGKIVSVSFTGFGTFTGSNIFKAEIGYAATPGSGLLIGQLVSTLSSGIVLVTVPSGYSGSYSVRVYSSSPYISQTARLISRTFTISSSSCITANNNSALLNIGGIGSVALDGTIAFQTNTTFNAGNRFIAQISDVNGSFGTPTNIGTVTGTTAASVGNLINVSLPTSLQTSSNYLVRVISTNPVSIGSNNGSYFTLNNAYISVYSVYGTNFCPGSTIPVEFDADGNFNSNNVFSLDLSASNGTFFTNTIGGLADGIGGTSLTVLGVVPQSVASAIYYRTRVSANSPYSQTAIGQESGYFTIYNTCFNFLGFSAGPYFGGDPLKVNVFPYTTFSAGNSYLAQLSDANGSFANPQYIGSVSGIGLATITGILPIVSAAGSNYYVRVISTKHAFTSSGYYLGTISPLKIVMSASANASAYCPGAYVKLGNFTVTGTPSLGNTYTIQMNDYLSTSFISPFNVLSFTSSASGSISVPGFNIPTSIAGTGYGRTFRVVSSSPAATSQNLLGAFTYNSNCYSSLVLNTGILAPNANYTATYSLNPNEVYAAGNQFIAEISDNNFTTAVGIGSVTSITSGVIPIAINNNLPTGLYQVRVRSTDFASNTPAQSIYVSQVNIAPGSFDNTKQYCQGGPIAFNNFTVSSSVNSGNTYIIQVSTSQAFPNGSTFDLTSIASSATGSIPTGNIIIPVNTLMGSNYYYYRIVATSPYAAVNGNGQIYISNACLFNTNANISSFCPSSTGYVQYGNVSLNPGNNITALLSDALGNFNTPLAIGNVADFNAGGSKFMNFTIPSGLQQGTNYKIKLISTDFVSESLPTAGFEIKQVCISQPGGFNTALQQCSFIPLVTVTASGSVNPGNEYRLILTNSSGTPVSGASLNSLLGTVLSDNVGLVSFENVVMPTVTGTYRLQVIASNPAVLGSLTNNFTIINNCLGAPYFPNAKICSGTPFQANVYIGSGNTYNNGNQFIVELSNASGSFAAPLVVGSQSTTLNNFNLVVTIPSGLPTGSGYQLRTRSTNPVFTSNAGNIFAIDQICLSAGTVDFGPYIGASSSISIPVVNVGAVNGGNTYTATLYSQYGGLIGTIGSSGTQTITGTVPAVSTGGYYYTKITSSNPVATSYNSNLFIVNPTDIKLGAVSGSYCVGSTVTGIAFTVAGTVGGGNQYFLDLSDANGYFYYGYNNLNSFADATTGTKATSAVLPLGIVSSPNYKFRVRASNGSISNEILVNINATFQWTGAIDKTWNTVGNWSCPLIPTANIDVLIPTLTGSNYPEIDVTNAVARNFTVNTGATASILANGLLSIYGNLNVNGTFNSNTLGGVYFQGAYASTHDILGTGVVNLGLVTVPGFNYLNIRNTVSRLYRYYNYGYTNNYSVVNNIYEFYNYNSFYAYNDFTVINRFHNEYVFNVYNTYVSNPSFYVGNYFVNNSQYFNSSVSNFYFTGANAQIIGTYAPTFYNFYVNNNVNLSLGVAINIGASYANSGYFNGIGYPVSFVNSGYNIPIVISGLGYSNFGSVVFNNIYGVNVVNNIAVQNDFVNIVGFNPGTNVISFTGNGIQNISSTGVNNLTFNGINVANVDADLNVQANLYVRGSFSNKGRFRNYRATYFENNIAQFIDGFGITRFNYFYNYNTHPSGLTILTNIVVDGNLENYGVLNAVGYTVSTTGIDAQTISGTSIATFGGIVNSNTVGVDINQDIVVQGSFANRGRLRSKSNTVTFGGDVVQTVSSTSETVFNTIIVTNNVAKVNLDGGFVVTGDIQTNGNFDASAAVISTTGTVLQTISGINEVTFGEIINTNTIGVVATQDVIVNGSFSNRGRFRSTQTLNMAGTIDQAITGTQPLELTNFNNDNTSIVTLEVPIEVIGNISNQGILDGSSSIISTSGIALQTISGDNISLGTIINTNISGGVIISDPIAINGDLVNNGVLESSSMVSFTGTNQSVSGTKATLVNDVAIVEDATVAIAGGFRTRGRFVNNSTSVGLVATPSSTVTFEGDTKQSIEGTTPTNFGQVSVTNIEGVAIEQNISSTSLSLSGGNLTVDTLKSVSITSANPDALVRTNDSYVDGTLSRVVTASGVAYTFPVGTTDAFRGVEVTFSGTNTAGKIAVTPSAEAPKVTLPAASGAPIALFDPTLGDTLKGILPLSWKVEAQNSTAPGLYDISLQAPVTLPGYTDPNALVVVKRADETSPWVLAGTPAPVTTTTGKVIKVGRRNASSFSEFAIAGTCSNVSRVSSKPSIDVIGNNFNSNLEGNNYEWSIDDTVQRALTSRQITPIRSGRYRVRVILSGCSSDASDFIEFTGTGTGFGDPNLNTEFKLYPNPTKGEFTLESKTVLNGDYLVEMFDIIGKPVFTKTLNQVEGKAFQLTYNTSNLPTGIYFIKISNKGNGKVLKLIVE